MITHFHFLRRPNMEDRSHRSCLVLSQTVPDSIGPNSLVQFSMQTALVRSVRLLSYLVFITDRTRSNRLQQFNFAFSINHNNTIGHIVVLFSFRHKLHPIIQVLTVQFRFWCRPHLYNQSCRFAFWFLSQTTRGLISHDNLASFLAQIAPI